jgi:tyrosinase
MKATLLLLATSSLCSAAAVRAPPKQTFQLFPLEKAKADAEKFGRFRPEPDHNTRHNHTAGKATDGVESDFEAAGACDQPAVRIEWRDLSDDDKNGFIGAIKCLMGKPSAGPQYPGSASRYEDLVSVHQQMTGSIHMVAQFLPWHRYYLSIYESFLRDECQYGGPMPWWDENKDSADFSTSPLFTDQWFGPIPPKGPNGEETCLGTGVGVPGFGNFEDGGADDFVVVSYHTAYWSRWRPVGPLPRPGLGR